MGFNKKYVPVISDLIKIRESIKDDDIFLNLYFYNPDALVGSKESIEYLEQLSEKRKEVKNGM